MNAVQKNHEVLEKIAQLLENLPSDSLLEKTWTEEQREYWHQLRDSNSILAQCWRAEFIVEKGDPIAEALDNKQLDPLEYELKWMWIKCYKLLWDMIEQGESDIKALHSALRFVVKITDFFSIKLLPQFYKLYSKILRNNYPFNSAYELFANILEKDTNDELLECLIKYQEISMNKGQFGLKQVNNLMNTKLNNDFTPQLTTVEIEREFQKLKANFPWEEMVVSWMPIALIGCQLSALSKPSMKGKLRKFYDLISEVCSLGITAYRKRESETWKKRRSYAWINGRRVYASPGGTYHLS